MDDYGEFQSAQAIRFVRVLPATPETVWEHLTDAAWLGGWLMPGTIEPRLGGAVVFRSPFTEGKIQCQGVVTAWEPPRRLAYTWRESSTESEVSYELEPVEDGVRLTLTHARMPPTEALDFAGGWHACMNALQAQLKGAPEDDVKAAWNGAGIDTARYAEAGAKLGL